jgi:hypothetical protein
MVFLKQVPIRVKVNEDFSCTRTLKLKYYYDVSYYLNFNMALNEPLDEFDNPFREVGE